jgi:hypothetical protein
LRHYKLIQHPLSFISVYWIRYRFGRILQSIRERQQVPSMHAKTLKLSLVCLFVVASAANAADIYKWTGENGEVHYGQEHPPGVQAERVRVEHGTRTPEEKQAAQKRLNKLVDEAGLAPEQVAEEDAEKAKEESADAETAAARADACTKARELLPELENRAKRARVENADGSQVWLDDNQRQDLIDRTREQIKENCDA